MWKLMLILVTATCFDAQVILWLVNHDVDTLYELATIAIIVVVQAYAVAEYVYVRSRALGEMIREMDKLKEEVEQLKQRLDKENLP